MGGGATHLTLPDLGRRVPRPRRHPGTFPEPSSGPERQQAEQPHAAVPRATPCCPWPGRVCSCCVRSRSLVALCPVPVPVPVPPYRIPFSFQRGRPHLRAARRAATMENMKWLHFDLGGSKMLHFMFGRGARGPAPLPGRTRRDPATASAGPPGPSRTLQNPPAPSKTLQNPEPSPPLLGRTFAADPTPLIPERRAAPLENGKRAGNN